MQDDNQKAVQLAATGDESAFIEIVRRSLHDAGKFFQDEANAALVILTAQFGRSADPSVIAARTNIPLASVRRDIRNLRVANLWKSDTGLTAWPADAADGSGPDIWKVLAIAVRAAGTYVGRGYVRLTLDIREEVYEQLRSRAAAQNTTVESLAVPTIEHLAQEPAERGSGPIRSAEGEP